MYEDSQLDHWLLYSLIEKAIVKSHGSFQEE